MSDITATSAPAARRTWATAPTLVAGGLLTLLAGILVQFVVIPNSTVAPDRFSHPWSATALIVVSAAYAVFHGLVAHGLLVVRGRVTSRVVRAGLLVAVVGTLLLVAGEVASVPFRDARMDDPVIGLVTGVLFGGGVVLSAVGLLLAGIAAVRRTRSRFTLALLGAGVVTAALGVLPFSALAIGIYGLALAAVGWTAARA